MLRPTAVNVLVLDDARILIEFDTGERKIMDVKPYIKGEWYGMLADPSCFRTVRINGYTVEWKDGQDICPDELCYCSVPIHLNYDDEN